jgi:hypothetical protein
VHERILAEAQREHEERLRRGERQYEDKKETYLDLLRASIVTAQIVHLTEPLLTWEGMPAPPEQLSPEAWRDLLTRVDAFGSSAVVEAAEAFDQKAREFNSAVLGYRLARDSADPSSDLEGATKTMLDRRDAVGKAHDELRRLVRESSRASRPEADRGRAASRTPRRFPLPGPRSGYAASSRPPSGPLGAMALSTRFRMTPPVSRQRSGAAFQPPHV